MPHCLARQYSQIEAAYCDGCRPLKLYPLLRTDLVLRLTFIVLSYRELPQNAARARNFGIGRDGLTGGEWEGRCRTC